jgi:signal transduction histidine kinase
MAKQLIPFRALKSHALENEARELLGGGIIDWVIAEKKTVVIPDPETVSPSRAKRNFVIIPLYVRNQAKGIYLVYTEKPRQEFPERDIRLLTVLARQAAAGVERWHNDIVPGGAESSSPPTLTGMIQGARLAMIEEVSACVAREIAEPLDAIDRKLSAARSGRVTEKNAWSISREVGKIREASDRMVKIARDVHADPMLGQISLNQAIDDIVAAVGAEFNTAGIEIETYCPAVPPVVTGHEHHLQQLLLSLLMSALDAMPKGGTITIATEAGSPSVVLCFTAAGAEVKGTIGVKEFRPFFTAGKKEADLGLLLSRRFLFLLGGTINVEREAGNSTKMTIILPTVRVA